VAEAYRAVAPPHLVKRLDVSRDEPKRGWRASWIAGGDDEPS
jgi:hypothetical protein